MSENNTLALYDEIKGLILSATGQIEFAANADRMIWADVSEAIDPHGPLVKAADLDGQTFTIRKMKRFESSFEGGPEEVYWIVAVDTQGQYFNTVLGGRAVVEELDKIVHINVLAKRAFDDNDEETFRHYLSVGAGKLPVVTLQKKQGGKFGRYYVLARNPQNGN